MKRVTKDIYVKLLQRIEFGYIFMNLLENGGKIWLTKQSKQTLCLQYAGKQQQRFCMQLSLIVMVATQIFNKKAKLLQKVLKFKILQNQKTG